METIYRAYKYRLYPNKEQEILINKHIGSCRWIYNYALSKKIMAYKKDKTNLNKYDLSQDLPKLKKQADTEWLKEVNSQSLQSSLDHMDKAFVRFFKEKKGFPKFKAKHYSKKSFHVPQYVKVDWDNKKVSLPKIKNLKFSLDRKPIGEVKSSTISKTPTNKYFISVLVDTKLKHHQKPPIKEDTTIGIDLGIKDFIVTSNGDKTSNPKYLKNNLFQLKKLQHQTSKKKKGSNNRKKANLRVAKKHEKIHNLRTDFLHKLSSKLISENQTLCLEDLNVEGMLKNHKLAQSIQDCSWSKFVEFLKYKADWYGANVIQIGRFEPSSKICSQCGWINKELELKDRKWTCQECDVKHDRDINAAINIKDYGLNKKQKKNRVGTIRISKPLENIPLGSSEKEETQPSLAVG